MHEICEFASEYGYQCDLFNSYVGLSKFILDITDIGEINIVRNLDSESALSKGGD